MTAKSGFSLFGALILGVCAASAQEAVNRKASIGDFGVFEPVGGKMEVVALPESTSGAKRTPTGIHFLERTRMIPAKKGVQFGFNYEITGAQKGPLEVMIIVTHPRIQKPDGSISSGFKFKEKLPVVDGIAKGFTGYSFDHEYELVPGEWKFEFWVREGKLLEWTFVSCPENQDARPSYESTALPLYEKTN